MVKAERRQNPNMQKILKYGEDLTNLAQEDKLDPVIGREDVIQTVIQILCKRTKNNPCLVGEPGVGKTVIAEALAQLIVSANAPSSLKGKKIISLNTARLLGGAENRGELEQRITSVVDEVRKGDGNIILFIDEIHIIIGLGAGGGSALDAGNILKPALARGECKCIGATTLYEYRKHIEKDPTLARRFQLVQIPEPSVNEAIDMLRVLCKVYEKHHNVQYEDEALVAAVQLSNYHISDSFLPDKSLDIIDEAGSRAKLLQFQDQSRVSTLFPLKKVTKGDIEHIVSARTGIPLEKLSTEESRRLLKMEETLHQHIIGQDKAIKAICSAIQRARLGIRDPGRPICSFLFIGPTGVGKTELANVLADEYFGSKKHMIRLDMSEYMERHMVSKLIGSPPGYIGHDESGQLTEAVHNRPHTIILFDEIEKAHPDVLHILLQILEDRRLTDGKGRTVDFKNTIIIATSNIGSNMIGNDGFQNGSNEVEKMVAEELKKNFRPEFLNRWDEVIMFKQLTKLEMRKIAEKFIKDVLERFKVKNIKLQVTDELKDMVVEAGYEPSYGARSLRRAITKHVEDELANKMLRKEIKEGDTKVVTVDTEGKMIISDMFTDLLK